MITKSIGLRLSSQPNEQACAFGASMCGCINNLAAGAAASALINLLHLLLNEYIHNSLFPTRCLLIYWRFPLGHVPAKHRLKLNSLLTGEESGDDEMTIDINIHCNCFHSFFIRGFWPSGERLHPQPDAGNGRGKLSFVAPGDLAAPQKFGNGKDRLVSALFSLRVI